MNIEHEKNIRRYPAIPIISNHSNNVIALPSPRNEKDAMLDLLGLPRKKPKIDEEWETIDRIRDPRRVTKKNKHIIDHGPYGIYDLDDENAWGGNLIDRSINPLAVLEKTTIDRNTDVSDLIINGNSPEYYHHFFKNEPEQCFWIVDNVLAVGGHPLLHTMENDLDFLRDVGIAAIVSAYEMPIHEKYLDGMDYYFAPTLEDYTADLIGICEFIEQMEENNAPVFVHSFDGLGRGGTIAAAYFIFDNWLTTKEAIPYIRGLKPGYIKTKYQEEALYKFASRL